MTRLSNMILGAALVVGCMDDDDDGPSPGPGVDWTADIVGIGAYANLRGSSAVSLADDGRSFSASIEIRNGDPGSVYPWHVHFGTCADTGAIIGEAAYPALNVDGSGTAAATADVPSGLDADIAYSVNVHLAPDNLATIIACGDLVARGDDDDDDDDDGNGGGGGGGGY